MRRRTWKTSRMVNSVWYACCGDGVLLSSTVVIVCVVWGVRKELSMGSILAAQYAGSQSLALSESTTPDFYYIILPLSGLLHMICTVVYATPQLVQLRAPGNKGHCIAVNLS